MKMVNVFCRSCLFWIGQSLCAIVLGGLAVLFFAFLPYLWRYRFCTLFSHFSIWWAKVICNIKYEVTGQENLPKTNAIVASNHQSAWETLFFQVLLPPQTWILKKELLYIPFFGWALALLEPIAINRQQSSSVKTLIASGKKRLQQGRWVIIFPEGTRVPIGKKHRFSRSAAFLAESSGYPIVPIAHNAGLFWPKNGFIKRPGTVKVVIGPPINPTDLSVDAIHQETQQWIVKHTDSLSNQS